MERLPVLTTAGFVLVFILAAWGCPQYSIYQQRLQGEAELARATFNRQVKVREAEAARDAAKLLAEAEVERAQGVAKANAIIGQSLKDNESYLRYLWIQQLGENKQDVIYVPTEANLPILEATRNVARPAK